MRVENCTIELNTCSGLGLDSCNVFESLVARNSCQDTVVDFCDMFGCVLQDNEALSPAVATVKDSRLYGCLVSGNIAPEVGGAISSEVYNCTISANNATNGTGGVRDCDVFNSIVYHNTGLTTSNWFPDPLLVANEYRGNFQHSCTAPLPQGTNDFGNVTQDPVFRDAAVGDFSVKASSPCIDAGDTPSSRLLDRDLAGNGRIFATIDMGGYEFTMFTEAKVLLEGAFSTQRHVMTTSLATMGALPPGSPFADAEITNDGISSNTTDWILLQLLSTNTFESVDATSGFVQPDGTVVNSQGSAGVRLEAVFGKYYLVAKHRNHLGVMSAQPIHYTNDLITYDFTMASSQAYEGTNSLVEVAPGVWAMMAGDADGDGEVRGVDEVVYQSQEGL